MMLDRLIEHREKLIYAFALLRGYKELTENTDLSEALEYVMDIIADAVHGAVIFNKTKEDTKDE
jgi:hypothetical protein